MKFSLLLSIASSRESFRTKARNNLERAVYLVQPLRRWARITDEVLLIVHRFRPTSRPSFLCARNEEHNASPVQLHTQPRAWRRKYQQKRNLPRSRTAVTVNLEEFLEQFRFVGGWLLQWPAGWTGWNQRAAEVLPKMKTLVFASPDRFTQSSEAAEGRRSVAVDWARTDEIATVRAAQ